MKRNIKGVLTVLLLLAMGGFAAFRVWQAYEKKAEAGVARGPGEGADQERESLASV